MTYTEMYQSAVVKNNKNADVKKITDRLLAGKPRYEKVASLMANGIPWWFIAVINGMEHSGRFDGHLHNGNPLTGKTFNHPKGRPLFNPGHGVALPSKANPYSWEESAFDALKNVMKFDKITSWSMENCLNLLERYNGHGYKRRNLPTPYLWSYTQHYIKGKYIEEKRNGKIVSIFYPNFVSKQPGCAALMKFLGV